MKHLLSVSAALLAGTVPVQFAAAKEAPIDLVKAAVAAEGGADALKALKSVAIKADAKNWEPGQSMKAGGEPRFLGDSTYSITLGLGERRSAHRSRAIDAVSGAPPRSNTPKSPPRRSASSPTPRAALRPPACGLRRSGANSSAPRRRCCSRRSTIPRTSLRPATRSSAKRRCRPSSTTTMARSSPSCSIPRPICRRRSARVDDDNINGDSNLRSRARRLEGGRRRAGPLFSHL